MPSPDFHGPVKASFGVLGRCHHVAATKVEKADTFRLWAHFAIRQRVTGDSAEMSDFGSWELPLSEAATSTQ